VSAQACQLLGAPRAGLLGRGYEELGVDGLQTAKGEFFYKALRAPQRSISGASVPRRIPKTAKAEPSLDTLAGTNTRYARALRMARQGLANELPVLLLGETGTGKEVIARACIGLALVAISPTACTRPARCRTPLVPARCSCRRTTR